MGFLKRTADFQADVEVHEVMRFYDEIMVGEKGRNFGSKERAFVAFAIGHDQRSTPEWNLLETYWVAKATDVHAFIQPI